MSDIYTITGDLAGIPCMSVPCGTTAEGLPVGMQILTRHFDETGMFRLADAFERPAVCRLKLNNREENYCGIYRSPAALRV